MERSNQTCVVKLTGTAAKGAIRESSLKFTPNVETTTEILAECIKQLCNACQRILCTVGLNKSMEW
jgi:hypothetical protein